MDNYRKYDQERSMRWGKASAAEQSSIDAFCRRLSGLTTLKAENERYDTRVFRRFPPDEHPWARGAADYEVIVAGCFRFLAEIKIKDQKFRKTMFGGATRRGSAIPKYGCESFYLDVDPVYKDIHLFIRKTGVDPRTFWLIFTDSAGSHFRVISVRDLDDLIENGYHGVKIGVFSEGYGTLTDDGPAKTFLIPELATVDLFSSRKTCLTYLQPNMGVYER